MRYDEQTLRPAIQAAFDQGGLDGVCKLVVMLLNEQEQRHRAEMARLEARIAELEKRLGKNSANSSKPPSSDGLKRRTSSLRANANGRKPGGQPGHPGQRLHPKDKPDKIIKLPLTHCQRCQADLTTQPVHGVEERQVFELPPIALIVTAYRAERKVCPACACKTCASFPAGVTAPTQYGPGMQAVMTYLQAGQLLPHERTAQVCEDLFGHRPSAGSIVSSVAKSAMRMQSAVDEIATRLKQEQVLHADETGIRCAGKTHWLHVLCSETLTHYTHSARRGLEGILASGVLPGYKRRLMHDFWGPYDHLQGCKHSRCNAHLLRELKACIEDGHRWAKEITSVLMAMKSARDEALKNKRQTVPRTRRGELNERYDEWVRKGLREHPEVEKPEGKRGRAKQSTERNLLKRLESRKSEIIAFLHDLRLPFDNNLAERDLRMMKVQQKISGCFRSEGGAKTFCVIRSYLSAARKQGINLITSIRNALAGYPSCFAQGC